VDGSGGRGPALPGEPAEVVGGGGRGLVLRGDPAVGAGVRNGGRALEERRLGGRQGAGDGVAEGAGPEGMGHGDLPGS
jgi:hypothetical protein